MPKAKKKFRLKSERFTPRSATSAMRWFSKRVAHARRRRPQSAADPRRFAWHPDPVFQFIRDKETDRRFLAAIGYGQSQERYKYYREPKKNNAEVKHIGEQYHVVWVPKHNAFRLDSNADHWKTQLFNACRTDAGEPGSIEFYASSDRNEHITLSKHFTAEEPKEFFEEGKGSYVRWIKHRKANHLLDVGYMNFVAAHLCGMRLLKNKPSAASSAAAEKPHPGLTLPDGRPVRHHRSLI